MERLLLLLFVLDLPESLKADEKPVQVVKASKAFPYKDRNSPHWYEWTRSESK